jgi:hypothetical protein
VAAAAAIQSARAPRFASPKALGSKPALRRPAVTLFGSSEESDDVHLS